jgi:hypothetical protein
VVLGTLLKWSFQKVGLLIRDVFSAVYVPIMSRRVEF